MDRTKRIVTYNTAPSLTKQSFKKESDINVIVKKYLRTVGPNFLDALSGMQKGQYGDFSHVVDYRDSLDKVKAADKTFMQLPAKLRYRFNNDVAQFLDFMGNPKNLDEMVTLGLVTKKEESSSVKAEAKP